MSEKKIHLDKKNQSIIIAAVAVLAVMIAGVIAVILIDSPAGKPPVQESTTAPKPGTTGYGSFVSGATGANPPPAVLRPQLR